jgi:hypothetical protein
MERWKEEEVKVDQNSDGKEFTDKLKCTECRELEAEALKRLFCKTLIEADKRKADRETNYVKNINVWLLWLLRYKYQA